VLGQFRLSSYNGDGPDGQARHDHDQPAVAWVTRARRPDSTCSVQFRVQTHTHLARTPSSVIRSLALWTRYLEHVVAKKNTWTRRGTCWEVPGISMWYAHPALADPASYKRHGARGATQMASPPTSSLILVMSLRPSSPVIGPSSNLH
jgi:hypothetical protein